MTKPNLTDFLQKENKALGPLLSRLAQLEEWNNLLKLHLGEDELANHCHVVNLMNHSLIVIADNPHWVTRLRFNIPTLLPKLRSHSSLENIQAICCKVQPLYEKVKRRKKEPTPLLSAKTAAFIKEIASKLNDKKIRAILERIASRTA